MASEQEKAQRSPASARANSVKRHFAGNVGDPDDEKLRVAEINPQQQERKLQIAERTQCVGAHTRPGIATQGEARDDREQRNGSSRRAGKKVESVD